MEEKTKLECYFCGEYLTGDGPDFETDKHDEGRAWHLDCIEQAERDMGARGMALLEFLQADDPQLMPYDLTEKGYDTFAWDTDYLVLTEAEADRLAEQGAQSYLDSIVLPEIPERYHHWFDEDRWIEDTLNGDGREFWIGSEAEDEILSLYDGERYYIYRR